jgi:hypothetical protein
MDIQGRWDNTAFNLPQITLIEDEEPHVSERAGKENLEMDLLERKVVVNSVMLISNNENAHQRVRTVATCLADAMGLCVDFSCLTQMS